MATILVPSSTIADVVVSAVGRGQFGMCQGCYRSIRETVAMKQVALLPLLFVAMIPTSGPSVAQDFWIKAQGSGCQVWSDEAMDNEIVKWSGACKDGKAAGKGKLTWTELLNLFVPLLFNF